MNARRLTTSLVLALALGSGACGDEDQEVATTSAATVTSAATATTIAKPTTVPPPSSSPATCSATGVTTRADEPADLPPAVATTRRRILEAAARCDYDELERLSLAGDGAFQYSYGQGGPAGSAGFWRDREAEGEPTLRTMIELLDGPPVRQRSWFTWPSPDPMDHRLGISETGDWDFFVAGD